MKCGYFGYQEYTNPNWTRYDCRWFGFSANTEKVLCQGCTIGNDGVPHIEGWEDLEEDESETGTDDDE